MQQRQLRLGDILDDYCPRERRVTNHAIVAMVGQDVKQTRCTTCDAEHEYKHAKIPRQRRKTDARTALYTQVLAKRPKRVVHDDTPGNGSERVEPPPDVKAPPTIEVEDLHPEDTRAAGAALDAGEAGDAVSQPPRAGGEGPAHLGPERDEGPVHRPLIRASLPRPDGQPPQSRPIPEFTIRQPGGRPNRFRQRQARGGQSFQGNRPNGNAAGGPSRGSMRSSGGRPPLAHSGRREGHGRKRSK